MKGWFKKTGKVETCPGDIQLHFLTINVFSPGCIREKDVKYHYNIVSSHDVENEEECAMLSVSTEIPETKRKQLFGNDGTLFWTFFGHNVKCPFCSRNSATCVLTTKRNSLKNEKSSLRGAVSGNRQCGKY